MAGQDVKCLLEAVGRVPAEDVGSCARELVGIVIFGTLFRRGLPSVYGGRDVLIRPRMYCAYDSLSCAMCQGFVGQYATETPLTTRPQHVAHRRTTLVHRGRSARDNGLNAELDATGSAARGAAIEEGEGAGDLRSWSMTLLSEAPVPRGCDLEGGAATPL